MSKARAPKEILLPLMAEHVLAHGLNTASLRPLAKAAQTSDRMLIYHFGNKDALIAELLQYLALEMAVKLDQGLPAERCTSNQEFLTHLVALLRTEEFRRYMNVWLDIVSAAGQGNALHRATGHQMISGYIDWIEARLPEPGDDPHQTAALMLTLIEGIVVMDTVGHSSVSDTAVLTALLNHG